MTEIDLHIDARMADDLRTHPCSLRLSRSIMCSARFCTSAQSQDSLDMHHTGALEDNRSFRNHACLIFTYMFENLITDYLQTHPYVTGYWAIMQSLAC